MQPENEKGMQTVYDKIITEHCEKSFFTSRVTQLRKLQEKNNYHMFNISTTQLRKYPIIIYKQKSEHLLSDLIENKQELLPTEIKSIIWQITKFMLQCQKMKINHLRLFPKSIVLKQKYKQGEHIFVKIKDFSMGKEFNEVSQGKHMQFFQFLHPELSVMNKMVDFKIYQPKYDIWSLGIILFYLIYGISPFCKQKKIIFSKTILRQYQNKNYQILFTNDKYKSINIFIAKCLSLQNEGQFSNWKKVKKYLLDKEQIYNELDFHNDNFQEICELYIRLMIFLSGIYCLINEQFQSGSHQFWENNIGLKNGLCQFTLMFMKMMKRRFQTIYSSYFFLIPSTLQKKIKQINVCLDNEIEHIGPSRVQLIFWSNSLTVEGMKKVQEICVKLKLQISELNKMPYSRRTINRQRSRNSFLERNIWKSIQTLYDYIDQILFILNMCKTRSKTIYEQFFISEAFAAILIEDFGYQQNEKIDVRNILANIMK